jgi:hypothetical protein
MFVHILHLRIPHDLHNIRQHLLPLVLPGNRGMLLAGVKWAAGVRMEGVFGGSRRWSGGERPRDVLLNFFQAEQ